MQVRQRVFVLAGAGDWLIPSADEAESLQRLLPHCRTRVLPGRSHALLQEADVDLAALLREAGFYTTRRVLSGNGAALHRRTPGLGTFGKCAAPAPDHDYTPPCRRGAPWGTRWPRRASAACAGCPTAASAEQQCRTRACTAS